MAGALGTLGVLLEISLKIPAPTGAGVNAGLRATGGSGHRHHEPMEQPAAAARPRVTWATPYM